MGMELGGLWCGVEWHKPSQVLAQMRLQDLHRMREAAAAELAWSGRGWGRVPLLGPPCREEEPHCRLCWGGGCQGSCLCLLGLEGSKLCPMPPCSPLVGGWRGPSPCGGCVVLLWLCNELLLHQVSAAGGFSASVPPLRACSEGGVSVMGGTTAPGPAWTGAGRQSSADAPSPPPNHRLEGLLPPPPQCCPCSPPVHPALPTMAEGIPPLQIQPCHPLLT